MRCRNSCRISCVVNIKVFTIYHSCYVLSALICFLLFYCARRSPARRMATLQQTGSLLNLPAELRNQIYNYIAYDDQNAKLIAYDRVLALPLPISQTSRRIRWEFNGIYGSVPLEHATHFTVVNNHFCTWEFILSLGKIPTTPAVGVDRTVVLKIQLKDSSTTENLLLFVKTLAGSIASAPKTVDLVRSLQYRITFDEGSLDLDAQRVTLGRLAKRYRFHHPEGEQRVFEKIYWAFAEEAERVDGVSVKQYALGCWSKKGGGFGFV